jgi:hypothetical protein
MAGLYMECNSAWQERDDACGWVNDLLGEVKMERGLKLKVEDVSVGLAMEVTRDKAKIDTLETKVSRQRGKIDKLQSDVIGESTGPMSFLFLDPRCLF